MYESFYGLKEKAFNLNPDPEYFYLSREHEDAYRHLEYAISESKGFAVITGEVGAGKTTLINYLLYKLELDINIGLITNTNIPASQFLKAICREFEINVDVREKVDIMEIFQDFLLERYAQNERVLLIIDEAQNISLEAMEEIRMLSNLEAEKSHLIQIILLGQPELKYKLQRNDLKQFAQRVSTHYHINGLSKDEAIGWVNSYHRPMLEASTCATEFFTAAFDADDEEQFIVAPVIPTEVQESWDNSKKRIQISPTWGLYNAVYAVMSFVFD